MPPGEDLPGQDQEVEAGPVSGTELLIPKGAEDVPPGVDLTGQDQEVEAGPVSGTEPVNPREERRMCLLVKTFLFRVRRWKKKCQLLNL